MILTKSLVSAALAVLHLATISSAGIVNRAEASTDVATYVHDGRTCCNYGDDGTAFINGRCLYGKASFAPKLGAGDSLTKCCWNKQTQDFRVHYSNKGDQPLEGELNIAGAGNFPNGFCNLGLKWKFSKYRLTQDAITLSTSLDLDCGPYAKSDDEWIRLNFNNALTSAGRFTYNTSSTGPTLYVDISTQVNRNNSSVDLQGRLTGTGTLSRLNETFKTTLSNKELVALVSVQDIC